MFSKEVGREKHYETAVCHCGEIIHVEWESFEDILIPENKRIIERTITNVTPKKYRFLGDEYLLGLCDKEERRKNSE